MKVKEEKKGGEYSLSEEKSLSVKSKNSTKLLKITSKRKKKIQTCFFKNFNCEFDLKVKWNAVFKLIKIIKYLFVISDNF